MRSNNYARPKQPCRNCRVVFEKLNGFIPTNGMEAGNRDTFLGACAEYIPVNVLMKNDTQDVAEGDVQNKLKQNSNRCSDLFKKL